MFSPEDTPLTEALNQVLPQTQCTRCGYPDCRSYAQAISRGEAEINQCPPGGTQGIARLAQLTGRAVLPLNPAHGREGPRLLAVIDEEWCIGCTLCIKACPVDSIIGGPKQMHTVVDELCTGCELCIPVCPVDCISLRNVTGERAGWDAWSPEQADQAKTRYAFHRFRFERADAENTARLAAKAQSKLADGLHAPAFDEPKAHDEKLAAVEAAMARARSKMR